LHCKLSSLSPSDFTLYHIIWHPSIYVAHNINQNSSAAIRVRRRRDDRYSAERVTSTFSTTDANVYGAKSIQRPCSTSSTYGAIYIVVYDDNYDGRDAFNGQTPLHEHVVYRQPSRTCCATIMPPTNILFNTVVAMTPTNPSYDKFRCVPK